MKCDTCSERTPGYSEDAIRLFVGSVADWKPSLRDARFRAVCGEFLKVLTIDKIAISLLKQILMGA